MKYPLLFIFSFFCFSALAQQKLVEMEQTGQVTLEEVILHLEKNYGFLFSYQEQDIQGVTFSKLPPKGSIDVFLKNLLADQTLQFEIVSDNYILLTKKVLPVEPPGVLLCGTIIDSLTQLPLSQANVYLKKSQKGISSKTDGSFKFRVSLNPQDTLVLSYVGYAEKQFSASDFVGKNCPTVALNYFDFGEDFVVVTEYLTDGISLGDNGAKVELQPNKIGPLPGQVEPDVLSTIQFLPGVSTTNSTAAGMSIRGGTPDQNLILWENIPIYHSAHYFGTLSAFNPYIINKVSVYRGGFGAEYGGRVSGVIDLKSTFNSQDEAKFGVGTNFINVYTNGQTSILNDKVSLVYSLRRSITELIRSSAFNNITKRIHQGILVQNVDLNRLPPGISISDDFKFLDSNIKLAYQVSDKDQLSVAWTYSKNDFEDAILDDMSRQKQSDTLFLENQGLSIAFDHEWGAGFSSKILGVHSDFNSQYDYSLKTAGENRPDKAGSKKSSITEQQIQLINTYQTKTNHRFKLAYELVNYDVAFKIAKISRNDSQANEQQNLNSNLHVLFASYSSPRERKLGLEAGLRFTNFQIIQDYCTEPRLKLWYQASDHLNVYANAGRYYQFLSQIVEFEGDNASIETPVWALAGEEEIPVLNANQYQLGFVFQKNKWLLDLQAYTKKINGITSLTTGFAEDLSNRFKIGSSHIQGIDILIKKRWKNYQTWGSYSISKIEDRFPTFFDKSFTGPNEQRHTFHWVNMWKIKNFECSLGWKIASGRPFSLIDNYEVEVSGPNDPGPRESIRPLVKAFNTERLPAEHRLDASVLYNLYPKNKGQWKGVIGLSLYNIYHQRNIYNREFYIKVRPNDPPRLEYTNSVDMGFTANFVVRIEW